MLDIYIYLDISTISTINNIYSFSCDGYIQGYYADPEAECQTFHICANLELTGDLTKYGLHLWLDII